VIIAGLDTIVRHALSVSRSAARATALTTQTTNALLTQVGATHRARGHQPRHAVSFLGYPLGYGSALESHRFATLVALGVPAARAAACTLDVETMEREQARAAVEEERRRDARRVGRPALSTGRRGRRVPFAGVR
jgi:hypothetical protein